MNPDSELTLKCTQCGGELHPDEGQIFLTCPFCNSTVYVDKSMVVFHWSLAPTLDPAQAGLALARWMSGNQTVKDLDRKAQVTGQTFTYFPMWVFQWRGTGGDRMALQPAAATSITEIRTLHLPAGDLQRYDSALDAQSTPPTVPLAAAIEWLAQNQPGVETREMALVHVPVYVFKYLYRGQVFTALVEAATGQVLANIYPAKSEAPYVAVAGLTAAVYLFLAVLALGGGAFMTTTALILAAVAAPILFFLAVGVASRV